MPVIISFTEIHFVLAHSTRRFSPWRTGPTPFAKHDVMLRSRDGTKTSPHRQETEIREGDKGLFGTRSNGHNTKELERKVSYIVPSEAEEDQMVHICRT